MNRQVEDIKAIREMMERSSKFLSLSGMVGVVLGLIAIGGAACTYVNLFPNGMVDNFETNRDGVVLLGYAVATVVVAVVAGVILSLRKSKKLKHKASKQVVMRTLYGLAVPVVAGGVVASVVMFRGDVALAVALTLVFYGLALINVSKYTYGEVHYLGLTDLVVGIVAVLFPAYVAWLWILGFGGCHILYGAIMHIKYDKDRK